MAEPIRDPWNDTRFFRATIAVFALVALTVLPQNVAADEPPTGRKLALLVGVKEYNHSELPNLRFAEHDVEDLAVLLKLQKFQVVVLTTSLGRKDPQLLPTGENIQKALKGLLQGVTKHDLIMVGLAGHGIQPLGSDFSYFCPMDGNPTTKAGKESKDPNVVESPATLVSIDDLLEQLRNSGVGQKLLLVDACRNDPKVRGRRGVEQVRIQSLPPETGVLLSCSAGQFAFEHESWGKKGNGAFFSQVVKGMEGAAADETGAITWETLAIYVRKRVPNIVRKVYGKDGGEQRPNEIKNFSGDFVPLATVSTSATVKPNDPLMTFIAPPATPTLPATPATVSIADPADPYRGDKAGTERSDNLLKLRLLWCPAGKLKRKFSDASARRSLQAGAVKSELDQANSQLMILEDQMRKAFKLQLSNRKKRAEYDHSLRQYEAQKKIVENLAAKRSQPIAPPPSQPAVSDVTLADGFWIGKYEVTQQEWESLMKTRPWQKKLNVKEDPRCPATWITWENANLFCKTLTEREHRDLRLPVRWKYSLPSEDQWEYACRANITTPYSFGRDEMNLQNFAWYKLNADEVQQHYAHPVGGKNPNAWGLCDMHGNVAEWCLELYGSQSRFGSTAGKAPAQRMVRGGAWNSPATACRSAERAGHPALTGGSTIGFRVSVVPSTEPAGSDR